MSKTLEHVKELDDLGLDEICSMILDGKTLTSIAEKVGVSKGALLAWIGWGDRSARVNAARSDAAVYWDDKAERGIENAADPFQLSIAKELAHHYRWRASKIAPKTYGDKPLEVGGLNGGPVVLQIVTGVPIPDAPHE